MSGSLIENWNGSAWNVVSSPALSDYGYLTGVAAVSSDDLWAVGRDGRHPTPIIEQWNGTSWTIVPSPSVTANGTQDTLSAVTALGAGDVWAVGSTLPTSQDSQTPAELWNGTAWQIVPTTDPSPYSNLLDTVAGTAGQPLWAAGYSTSGGEPDFSTLVETTTG